MDILAQYKRAAGLATESFILGADRITIRSSCRYCELIQANHPHSLRGVIPLPIAARPRSPGFVFGGMIFLISVCLASAYGLSGGFHADSRFPIASVVVALCGLAWAWRCSRRWYAVRFYNDVGGLAFTLRCPVEDEKKLDTFVASVTQQVRIINAASLTRPLEPTVTTL